MIVRKFLAGGALCLFFAATASAAEYYIAPSGGSDANDGSLGAPFATFTKAINSANAGDTIFARGGTYNLSNQVAINKSGGMNNPIKLFAYPGETPILDFGSMADADGNRGVQMSNNANWWHVRGITIQNAGDNGLYTEGDNGVFEQLVLRYNRDSGLQLHGTATANLVLNCDSYENYDPPRHGEDADGFAAKFENLGPGNIFRGNRAWGNSDDGWDAWNSPNGVLIENSWSFDNGFNTWGDSSFAGDGTGYKLGHDGGPHVLANVLAWNNAGHGIDINGNGYNYDENGDPIDPNGSKVLIVNSVSYDNGKRNWLFDEQVAHVLRNNVSFNGGQSDSILSAVDDVFNTWNGIPVLAADFLSLVDTIARGPRNPDGSLPASDFLKLVSDSNLIDAGTPISFVFNGVTYNLPYNGMAPDLGAYETAAPGPALLGDFNGDGSVDAVDYTVWRNHLGETDETNINDSGDGGDVGPGDYDLWKSQYGESLAGSGGLAAGIIPEPNALVLATLAIATFCASSRRRQRDTCR